MVQKTRKHTHTKGSVHTIPQLRRLFEAIETFVDERIQKHEAKDVLSRELRKEWKRLFMKEIDKKGADAFIEDRMKHTRKTLRHTIKKGGAMLTGAPLDYQTRPGVYLAPQSVPVHGHLTQSGGAYGSYINYVNHGFANPEMGISYDPVPGQQQWPVPYESTGSNLFQPLKGGRMKRGSKKQRRIRRSHGGTILDDMGATLSQAYMHPFASGAPPFIAQDMQSMAFGSQLGASANQIERGVNEVHAVYKVPTF